MQTNDGIVLLAKQPGVTSFSSLNNVKKSLHTTKVGHTGTLDSFAQGLLVVCTGRLTKLAAHITEFDKTYIAVVKFGEETDTLEYTGNVIKNASLPSLEALKEALAHFNGEQLQSPPSFSAIHVDGHRASDLARKGIEVEIPKRKITVFCANLLETELSPDGTGVLYAKIEFSVSKGTYIRCLARDIAAYCKSAGHLAGLLRTKVGNFMLEDSAGYSLLNDFSIENCKKDIENYKALENLKSAEKKPYVPTPTDLEIQKQVLTHIYNFTEPTALLCGFSVVHLKNQSGLFDFTNGKKLKPSLFNDFSQDTEDKTLAVFYEDAFKGLVKLTSGKYLSYIFVLS